MAGELADNSNRKKNGWAQPPSMRNRPATQTCARIGPDASTVTHTHDLFGNVTQLTDASGTVHANTYDDLNRLTGRTITPATGGVSVGDYDFVSGAIAELGLTVHFSKVAVKPGKPITFATAGAKAVFGLPGNPVSAFLMFHLFVLRAAASLTGADAPLRRVTLPLAAPYRRKKADRVAYVPARITDAGGVLAVEFHGSAHLLALVESGGFFEIPQGTTQLPAGEPVSFLSVRNVFG